MYKMNVYIVIESPDYGVQKISKVFSKKQPALDFRIERAKQKGYPCNSNYSKDSYIWIEEHYLYGNYWEE